jgi:hypothetical protein
MSSTFTVTRDQIITLALRKLGVLELGSVPDSETVANASLALNLFVKQMATEGLKLWTVNQLVLPLVNGQTQYSIGPASQNPLTDLDTDKPLKVIQAWLRQYTVSPPIDTPVQILSQQEYKTLGSKFSTGVANSIYYEVRQNNGNMYVYLTPDYNAASQYELYFMAQQPIQDINYGSSIPNFPNEWMNTLVWNLADQLAIEYSLPANHRQEIAMRAKEYRDQLTDWDVESTSTFFQADLRMANLTFGQPN